LAEVRFVVAGVVVVIADEEGGIEGTVEGGDGGGVGLAYNSVHWRAVWSCVGRFRRKSVAIVGTSGSEGLGSVRRELSESTTLKIDSAGDQLFFKISIQTLPLSEMFI
jgi:hypothetical protein